jgi:hypothetical protein
MTIEECRPYARAYIEKHRARREKLIKMSETEALNLPYEEQYDRCRWLREIEGWEMVERHRKNYVPSSEPKSFSKKYSRK